MQIQTINNIVVFYILLLKAWLVCIEHYYPVNFIRYLTRGPIWLAIKYFMFGNVNRFKYVVLILISCRICCVVLQTLNVSQSLLGCIMNLYKKLHAA